MNPLHFLALFILVDAWHIYNDSERLVQKANCPTYADATKPFTNSFIDEYKLWPGLMDNRDYQYGETIYGSKAAIEMVDRHQHPISCDNSKFIISRSYPAGFGAKIHIEGVGLAVAMQMNRVLIASALYLREANIPYCKEYMKYTLECFYEDYSNCSSAHYLRDKKSHIEIIQGYDVYLLFQNETREQIIEKYSNFTTIEIAYVRVPALRKYMKLIVPDIILPLIQCSPVRLDSYFYWWRAITSTYFFRPNKETLNLLSSYRNLSLLQSENCVSVHVRHGDKDKEMRLVPFENYLSTVEILKKLQLIPKPFSDDDIFPAFDQSFRQHKLSQSERAEQQHIDQINYENDLNISIFLSTEDLEVIEIAKTNIMNNNSLPYHFHYTNLFQRSIYIFPHHELEYISMLLNLEYSLKCIIFICTLASNTCRVIDELRGTIGGKANRYYADLSIETCTHPPCIDGLRNISKYLNHSNVHLHKDSHGHITIED